jgi:hypothetical protein
VKTRLLVSLASVVIAFASGCEGKKETTATGSPSQNPPTPAPEPRAADQSASRVPAAVSGEPKTLPSTDSNTKPKPATDTATPPQPSAQTPPRPQTQPQPSAQTPPKPAAPKSEGGAALLAQLEKLPVGLKVVHTPAKVKARKNDGSLANVDARWTYHWSYATTVSATDKPLTIVQFGSCEWIDGKWAIPQNTDEYDVIAGAGKDFGEWYSCPEAKVETGKEYKDPQNWSGSKTVRAFKQKWYYIAKDADGKFYKGEAEVELLGELDTTAAKDKPGKGK